jgi:hypothetical protein
MAAHLRHADIAVPIRDRAIGRIGLESHASQPIRRWMSTGSVGLFN